MSKSNRVVIIIQARMTSTRLPGKVLKEVLGKTLLDYQIERVRRAKLAHELVIATTTNDTDQPILDICKKLGVKTFRGSENDVLARYHGAAQAATATHVVRVTSDCPLIDPAVIDSAIQFYFDHSKEFDYVTNRETYPVGMDTEVFSFQALDEIFHKAKAPPEREHVTPYLYTHPQEYRVGRLDLPKNERKQRWTVDTPKDFELISKILNELYPKKQQFTMQDIFKLLEQHPDWKLINA